MEGSFTGDAKAHIRHGCEEEGDIPGWESVTIDLIMPPEMAGYQVKEFEVLPTLLHALGIASCDPDLPEESQTFLELCRRKLYDHLRIGTELPDMRFRVDKHNTHAACLRVHLYVPRFVADRSRVAKELAKGISLTNEVARSR